MAAKNVLVVIETLSGGGAELVVANLCKYLDRHLFNVSVCCLGDIGHRGEELKAAGYQVDVLPARNRRIDKYLKWSQLAKLAKKRDAHLLHSHSPGSLFDCAVAAWMLPRVKHIHTFHFGNYPHMPKRMLLLERAFSRLADKLVAVGKEQRKIISRVFSLPAEEIEVVWNGIEMGESLAQPGRATVGATTTARVVICSISTFIEQKGLSYLLDAVRLLRDKRQDFELWMVGDGPLKEDLIAKAAACGLGDFVKFSGWAYNASTTVLPKIDVFVQSSLWEAMSMAVIEAMAACKPVVVTDVGDNPHVIDNGVDGIVVPRMNAERMAEELDKLIADETLRQQIGRRARQKVADECTVQLMARRYERLYEGLLHA